MSQCGKCGCQFDCARCREWGVTINSSRFIVGLVGFVCHVVGDIMPTFNKRRVNSILGDLGNGMTDIISDMALLW